jgi:hypothetical protein
MRIGAGKPGKRLMERKEEELRRKEMSVEARDVEGTDIKGERDTKAKRNKRNTRSDEMKRRRKIKMGRKYLRK